MGRKRNTTHKPLTRRLISNLCRKGKDGSETHRTVKHLESKLRDAAKQNNSKLLETRQAKGRATRPRRDGDDGDDDARTLTVKPLKSMDVAGSGTKRCPVSCGSGLSRVRGMPGVRKAS